MFKTQINNRIEKIKNFFTKNEKPLLILAKSEVFRIGFIIFFCLFAIGAVFPMFLDNSKLKFDIANRLNRLTQATISIRGDISISLLPSPSITLNNVFIENYAPANKRGETDNFYNIYAKTIKIIFPIFKFNNKKLISKIIVDESVIEIAQPDILRKIDNSVFNVLLKRFSNDNPQEKIAVKNGLSSKFFRIEDIESTAIFLATPPDLQINNSVITFFNAEGVSKEFLEVYSTIKFNDNKIEGYGSFASQNLDNQFKILAKFNSDEKKPDSFFSLNSPIFNLKISGNFLENNINGILKTKFNGFLDANIIELKDFYKTLVSSGDLISEKLKYNGKSIKITSNISNDGKNIDMNNISVNSSIAKGEGNIYINLSNYIPTADIKLDFDELNIDNIWSTENPAKKIAELDNPKNLNNESASNNNPDNKINNAGQKLTFKSPLIKVRKRNISDLIIDARDYDISIDIGIKRAILYEGKVEDIRLYGNIANEGKIMISPLSFKLPGNSEFRINGILDNSNANSKFSGHLDGIGESLYEVLRWLQIRPENIRIDNLKKFHLYSDIEMDKNLLSFENLYINLDDKKTEFYGDIDIKDFDKKRLVSVDINASELDLKKYAILANDNTYIKQGILLDKLLWLNDIYSDYNLKFKFDKLIYDENIFNNQDLVINLGQGYIKVPKVHFNSSNNIFDFELNIDISDKNQIAKIMLNAEKLKINLQRNDFRESKTNYRHKNLFDKFFELPSFQGFSGNIDITAKEIAFEDKKIKDFDYKNSLKNSIFGQTKISMKIYDGTFEYKGLCDIKYNKIINGTFFCKACDLYKMLNDFYNVEAIEGVANISGNIVGIGKSVEEFKQNINSEISLAISNPLIHGYGLSDLMIKMLSTKEYARELIEPEKIIENENATTQYLQGKGFINLKGEKNSNFSISLTSRNLNSVFSGIIFLQDETLNGTINTVFLAGLAPKQTPINVATNVVGYFDDVALVSNLNQVRQYLGLERIDSQELNSKLITKTEAIRIAKKNNISNKNSNKKRVKRKATNNSSTETTNEENVTIENEVIEETQIIEVDNIEDIKSSTSKATEKNTTTNNNGQQPAN